MLPKQFLLEERIKIKKHHKKVLFNTFHMNGHALGFPQQIQNMLELITFTA